MDFENAFGVEMDVESNDMNDSIDQETSDREDASTDLNEDISETAAVPNSHFDEQAILIQMSHMMVLHIYDTSNENPFQTLEFFNEYLLKLNEMLSVSAERNIFHVLHFMVIMCKFVATIKPESELSNLGDCMENNIFKYNVVNVNQAGECSDIMTNYLLMSIDGMNVKFNMSGERGLIISLNMQIQILLEHLKSSVLCHVPLNERLNDATQEIPESISILYQQDQKDKAVAAYSCVLQRIWQMRLKRDGEGSIYQRVFSSDGIDTLTCKMTEMTASTIAANTTNMANTEDVITYHNLKSTIIEKIITHSRNNVLFPIYEPVQYKWSFDDGIYDGATNTFFTHVNSRSQCMTTHPCKYLPANFGALYAHHCSNKRIEEINIHAIPTPHLDKILLKQICMDSQNPSVCELNTYRWCLGLLGRLYFDVGSLDGWQVAPFLFGKSGCGKSVILNLIKASLPDHMAKQLSETHELIFGLQSIYKAKVIAIPESGNLPANCEDTVKKMIAGESVSVPRKNMAAIDVKWKAPLIFAGNALPKWKNDMDSIRRRQIFILFSKPIKQSERDTRLETKALEDIPQFILKIIVAYHQIRLIVGSSDFNDKCPIFFHESADSVYKMQDSLRMFIESDILTKIPSQRMLFRVFNEAYVRFCSNSRLTAQRISANSDLSQILEKYDLRIDYISMEGHSMCFVMGCNIENHY